VDLQRAPPVATTTAAAAADADACADAQGLGQAATAAPVAGHIQDDEGG
jgi:hypothetical protein